MTGTTPRRRPRPALSRRLEALPRRRRAEATSRFDVAAGEVHALLGENGAGKSTLMGVAAGVDRARRGHDRVRRRRRRRLTPAGRTALGLAIVHQHPALLPDLTVAENMAARAAGAGARPAAPARDVDARAARPRRAARVDLGDRVEDLSVAQRQLIELAKALALDPRS